MGFLAADLPIELWRMIVRFAIDMPASLDSSPIPPLQCRIPGFRKAQLCGRYHDVPYNEVIVSRITRGSCMRVSKLWRTIAEESALEWILVNGTSGLDSLAGLLGRSMGLEGGGQGVTNLSLGALVQRVDYRRKGFESEREIDDEDKLDTIIRSCPNLVVLNAYCDRSVEWGEFIEIPDILFDIGSGSFGHSLRYLTWDETLVGAVEPLLPILQQHGLIEVLILFLKASDFPETLTLPRLHTLEATGDWGTLLGLFRAMDGWDIPLLTHLTLFMDEDGQEFVADTDFNPFLDKFGENLTFMSLHLPSPDLPHILATCPFLQHFVMGITDFMPVESETPLIATHNCLERVALEMQEVHGLSGWMNMLEDHLRFFSEFNRPTSKVVCIIDPEPEFTKKMSYLAEDKLNAWRALVDEFAPIIQFEHASGNIINIHHLIPSKSDGDAGVGDAGENEEENGDE
jgi:hypothetical protein